MFRLSFCLVVLSVFCLIVSAVKVDVEVNVAESHHNRHHNHHNQHNENHEEAKPTLPSSSVNLVPEHEVRPLPILPESEVDDAEYSTASDPYEVPVQKGKRAERSQASVDNSFLQVGASNGGDNENCQVNAAGLKLIENYEGFVDHWYKDAVGVETIGYGCTSVPCHDYLGLKKITQAQAQSKLVELLSSSYGACVRNAIGKRHLTGNQFAALTSLVYNVGCGALTNGIATAANEGNLKSVAQQMARYNRAGGRVLSGLVTRRAAEIKLFNTASKLC